MAPAIATLIIDEKWIKSLKPQILSEGDCELDSHIRANTENIF